MRKFMRLSQRCWRVPDFGLHAALTIISSETDEQRLRKCVHDSRSTDGLIEFPLLKSVVLASVSDVQVCP